jgi:hypothetical protein
MIDDFVDPKDGGFFYTADDHESLLALPKDPYDGALPGANSVAIRNLVALAKATGEPRYLEIAGKALDAFSSTLARTPGSLPLMLVALGEYLDARPARPPGAPAPTPAGEPPAAAAVVTARAELAGTSTVAPGAEFEVELTLNVKPGWHVYANPTGALNLIPTTVTLAPDQPATLVKVTYPAGQAKVLDPASGERVALYEGSARLRARVRLAESAKEAPALLQLQLRYQACNDNACLAPATLDVPVKLGRGR